MSAFHLAIFAFLVYYLFFLGRHGIVQTLVISAAVPIVCFFFFDVAMRIVLPTGMSFMDPIYAPLYELFY